MKRIDMKNILLLFVLLLGFAAQAQEKPAEEIKTIKIEDPGKICILWPQELKPIPLVFNADDYYRSQVVQVPSEVKVGTTPVGSMQLSEDLPFVHTINGSVYTFDFLRYSVR